MRYLTCLCLTLSLIACDQSEVPKAKPVTPKLDVVVTQTLPPLVSTIEKSKTIKPKCKGDDCPNIEIEIDRFNDDKELSALVEREYVSTGADFPFAERTALEAEYAALALEALRIGHEAERAKVFRRMTQNASLLTQLLRLLDERGLWPLAVEASERADIELQALTPWRTAATTNNTEATHV